MQIAIWEGDVTPELVAAFERLTPQLSTSNPSPGIAQLTAIVQSPATDLFIARGDDGTVIGTATLAVFRIPTALRAWIEDVVVVEAASGKGVGSALTTAMIERARALGCATVDLTSRPSREAANHMYQKLGFVRRETNVYRIELEAE
jgi:ribosomal protein S18 acetylase RimI-like enzyme